MDLFAEEHCRPAPASAKRQTLAALILLAAALQAGCASVIPDEHETTVQPAPVAGGPNVAMLRQCWAACDSGVEAIRAFCPGVPPNLRLACFGLEFATLVGCKGWCYCQWGT